MPSSKSILTIATGKPHYRAMAVALARSYRKSNPASPIAFIIATDKPDLFPRDVREFAKFVPVDTAKHGIGFEIKLSMDKFSDYDESLYIDADCLVAGDVGSVFDAFAGRTVSTIGEAVSHGEWFGDVEERCRRAGVPALPRFVGSVYYFDNSDRAKSVFKTARDFAGQYDEMGIVRLRGKKNEEPLISLAMAKHGLSPLPDDGTIKADAMHFPDRIEISVTRRFASFANLSGKRMTTSPACQTANPIIAHFNDEFANHPACRRETAILRWTAARRVPERIAEPCAKVLIEYPLRATDALKSRFRPLYRRCFGVRKVKRNSRL